MMFSADLILDVPYGSYRKESIQITTNDRNSLITEAIPDRAFKEFERFGEGEWTHVNVKFRFDDLEIEYVFDLEKKVIATVYFSKRSTGEILSRSRTPVEFTAEEDLKAETSERAAEAGIL